MSKFWKRLMTRTAVRKQRSATTTTHDPSLLLETGDVLLMETGDRLLLE